MRREMGYSTELIALEVVEALEEEGKPKVLGKDLSG
jgi:hypothetical protein